MQVIAESLAMGSFNLMKEELPRMSDDARIRVEDFAVAALRMLCSPEAPMAFGEPLFAIFREVGVDTEVAAKERQEKLLDPAFRDYVIPQLQRLELITDRTAPASREMELIS